METPSPRPVADEEPLSQWGVSGRADGRTFPTTLRSEAKPPEVEMSLLMGRLTAHEAGDLVSPGRGATKRSRDRVRHTTAGRLRLLGFVVEHTPYLLVPGHISVSWTASEWDDGVARDFDSCFDEPMEASDG